MFYVYVLYSEDFDKIYIGYSEDVEKRLKSHNDPRNKGWTKRYQSWILVYKEEFQDKTQALKRERELKTAKGRDFIWKKLINK